MFLATDRPDDNFQFVLNIIFLNNDIKNTLQNTVMKTSIYNTEYLRWIVQITWWKLCQQLNLLDKNDRYLSSIKWYLNNWTWRSIKVNYIQILYKMWRTESRGNKGINDVDDLESRKKYNLHIYILTTCIGVCPKYLPPRNTDFVIGAAVQ